MHNQWFIAAWSDDLGPTPSMIRILDRDIVLYRTRAGVAVALSGLCPHRQMPLGTGAMEGDMLVCPYHGASFAADGRCMSLPFQAHVPDGMDLTAYAVVEQYPFVWLWGGDGRLADRGLLPDTTSLDVGAGGNLLFGRARLHVRARSQILLENLFDQSHISFTHRESLGVRTGDNGPKKPSIIEERPGYLSFEHASDVMPTDAVMRSMFPDIGAFMRVQTRCELFGVGLVNAVGTRTIACAPDGTGGRAVGCLNFLHGVTPESATTTHYFTAISRDFAADNAGLTKGLAERNEQIVQEDIRILEAIEPYLAGKSALDEPNFVTDSAAIRVRRRMDALRQAAPA